MSGQLRKLIEQDKEFQQQCEELKKVYRQKFEEEASQIRSKIASLQVKIQEDSQIMASQKTQKQEIGSEERNALQVRVNQQVKDKKAALDKLMQNTLLGTLKA